MVDGNFVQAGMPDIRFDSLQLPDGTTAKIETTVVQRDAAVVKMSVNKKHSSLKEMARQEIENRKREALETFHHPNLGDRLEKWVYAQLPGSPPTIWTGTQYDAELTAPLEIPEARRAPLPQAEVHGAPTGVVEARLTVDSEFSQRQTWRAGDGGADAAAADAGRQAGGVSRGREVLQGLVTLA